jgi:pimeloyl-ACP methyl ester carboxylesterase
MRSSPDTERPSVLIVGGLLAPPIAYRRIRPRLIERGAARVDIAPVLASDWARAGLSGFGALQGRVVRAIERTFRTADGRPIVVVGHSGGGLLARLAMCDAPYRGRVGGAAPMVGCLVTLGSPHALHQAPLRGSHEGVRLAAFLAEHAPGACHAPGTAYVTVASDAVAPRVWGERGPRRGPIARMQHAFFRRITGPTLAPGSDGIVSLVLAHLDGARQLTLHDALHGVVGSPWYGDPEVIDQWWPDALDAWRDARRSGATTASRQAAASRLG